MMKLLITVDTELWPAPTSWPHQPHTACELESAYEHCILGRTSGGDFGLPLLLADLHRYDLKAVFFVESLFAAAGGKSMLRNIVESIRAAAQDVQLHLHTEWLAHCTAGAMPRDSRQNLSDYDFDEQYAIIQAGIELLRAAGAPRPSALRAGNMSGNAVTTCAAATLGIAFDFSAVSGSVAYKGGEYLLHAAEDHACTVVPLTCVDYASFHHCRPAQLGAVSSRELEDALLQHAAAGNDHACILLHSFELVQRGAGGMANLNPITLDRWQRLCEFLAQRRTIFETVHCTQLDRATMNPQAGTVRGRSVHLPGRFYEQAVARLTK